MKTAIFTFSVLICLLLVSNSFANETTHRDDVLGINFPENMGDFEYWYESYFTKPEYGKVVEYIIGHDAKASLSIYDKGLKNIPDGITSHIVKDEFKNAKVCGKSRIAARRKNIRKTDVSVFTAKPNSKPIQYLWVRCSYNLIHEGRVRYHTPRINVTYLTAVSGKFILVSFTYRESFKADHVKATKEFLEEFSRLVQK